MTKSGFSNAMYRSMRALALLATIGAVQVAYAQAPPNGCGALNNPYGPYDYRTDRGLTLAVVDNNHFTPQVEQLIKGITGSLGGEINFTLRAFPNHHRALMALIRLGKKTKSPQPPDVQYSIECYLERAMRFRPDDTTVRMIYANYLFENSRPDDAVAQLKWVDSLAGDNAFTHYNAGLIFMEHKYYDLALNQAKKAYAGGFLRPDLRDQLKAVGKWNEDDLPAPATVGATESNPTSAAAREVPK